MKKIALFVAASLALIPFRVHADSVQITLYVGQLLTSGSSPMSDGYLLQVISDTSSNPGSPTAASFTGTDANEVVLTSTSMNSAGSGTGVAGDTAINIAFNLGTAGTATATGSFLFLRWYPTLLGNAATPGAGTSYGQYTSTTEEYPSDSIDIPWTIPAAGNYDMYFLTQSQDSLGPGTPSNPPPNSAGVANLTVAPVPEPSSFSMMAGAFAVGAVFLARRR